VQVLLTESGSRVVEVHRPVAYDELILGTRPLWRPRRVRVRVAARPSTQDDVDRLAEAVEAAGEAEGVLLAALGVVGELRPPTTLMVVWELLMDRGRAGQAAAIAACTPLRS
jgi:hypothetical protein